MDIRHFFRRAWNFKQVIVVVSVFIFLLMLRGINRRSGRSTSTQDAIKTSTQDAIKTSTQDAITTSTQAMEEKMKTKKPKNSPSNVRKEVLTSYPETFIKNMKNPCWLTPGKNLYCLPYFYLAGMPKSGTTDVWMKLMRHPQIWGCSKEPHWWGKIRIGRFFGVTHLTSNASSYYNRWGEIIQKAMKRRGRGFASRVVVGDGSASTFWDQRYSFHSNISRGPSYLTASLIHSIQPDAKIVVIFRNPVDRLFSDYLYFTKNDTSPADFHGRVMSVISDFEECLRNINDLRTCVYQPDYRLRLRIGLYSVYVEEWMQYFSHPSQLLAIKTEDWSKNCQGILTSLHRFLGLDKLPKRDKNKICSGKRSNVRNTTKFHMFPETERLLYDFYSTYNKRLAVLFNDNNFTW